MRSSVRWIGLFLLAALFAPACTRTHLAPPGNPATPMVRVRLLSAQNEVTITCNQQPLVRTASNPTSRRLNVAPGTDVKITHTANGWLIGNVAVGTGELIIQPPGDGAVAIDGRAYRGRYRLVPVSGGFDVVNDVDVDSYLKSVLPRELFRTWHDETYKAQAIVARTYALYEARTAGVNRHWDLHPDVRSQVYGGLSDETGKSRRAVEETAGVVVVYGPAGQERIFKTYFSGCCGGVSQSAADAFNDPYIEPLSDQNTRGLCSANPHYSWGPFVVSKDDLTTRFRAWGDRRNRAEKDMTTVSRIDIQTVNRWGRPSRFLVTDSAGGRYSLTSEELRWAVNTNASRETTMRSSFAKTVNEPAVIRFVEGRGHGHGVGMCQWCSQIRAENGMRHEDIILSAFQRARLMRAY